MRRRDFLRILTFSGAAASARLGAQGKSAVGFSIAHDPDRPDYHLLPPHNWMNDPNGPIFWKGKYHLFYQLNPSAAVWGDMHWGHATSTDMVHWQHEPIALAPTPGGEDSAGCFSGSAVVFDGHPVILYTGVRRVPPGQATILDKANNLRECQMLATGTDDSLNQWTKYMRPIIAAPPNHIASTGFRDPCVWFEDGAWWMIVGSGMRGIGGCALLYRAKKDSNLTEWEYLHPLASGKKNGKAWPGTAQDVVDSGEMWECPDFFELGNQHCLLYSTERKVLWQSGTYAGLHFTPQQSGLLDHGAYYAPKSFMAPDGRRILWGWIPETRPEAAFARAGWAGAMSLPRVLHVSETGKLQMEPAAEVNSLRQREEAFTLDQHQTHNHLLQALKMELLVTGLTNGQQLELNLRQHGETIWSVAIDGGTGVARCGETSFGVRLDETPSLRLFLDGSVIESFFGKSEACTARVYGLKPGETECELKLHGQGSVQCRHFAPQSISSNKLTGNFPPR